MYETRQNKEKVSRRIDGGEMARQRVKMESYRKGSPIVTQHPIIQAVSNNGFRTIRKSSGIITLAVDRRNLGHTYIVIEMAEGIWMYHFKANAVNSLTKFSKIFAWKGTFEKIEENNGFGKNPQNFIKNRAMSFNELKVSGKKAVAIKNMCEKTIGNSFFSLVLSNIKVGDNCFSKVYNILKEAGFELTWSSYLLSFISPRLALWLGSGFCDKKDRNKKSFFSYK